MWPHQQRGAECMKDVILHQLPTQEQLSCWLCQALNVGHIRGRWVLLQLHYAGAPISVQPQLTITTHLDSFGTNFNQTSNIPCCADTVSWLITSVNRKFVSNLLIIIFWTTLYNLHLIKHKWKHSIFSQNVEFVAFHSFMCLQIKGSSVLICC